MITDWLYALAQATPEKTFLYFADRQITYRQMADMVSVCAQRLHAQGIAAGQNVAMLCGNRPAFLIAWFAVSELGAVAVPLNTGLIGDGLRYTLTQSESTVLLIEPNLLEEKRESLSLLERALAVTLIDEVMEQHVSEAPRWSLAKRPELRDPNSILYTSGTTGLPKGAVLPHGSYAAAGIDMVQSLQMTANDRILVFLPLFHANPQMYAVVSTLRAGASIVLLPKFSASHFFDDAIRYGATGFTYVGTVLSILEKQVPEARHDHRLKWCVGGGAPERVWREVQGRFAVEVRELYGMTETGGWVSMNVDGATRFGSVGRARAQVDLSIRNEQGQPLGVGQKGEIVVSAGTSQKFFTGYWNNPQATASTLRDGWLYTGDRGWLDEDGYLYFDGRVKELIRRGGEMIAPTEIEQQLLKHPAVRDCAVVGVADEMMGEEVQALVVCVGVGIDAAALRQFLIGKVPDFMLPRYIGFVDAIPKTETQKVKRHELAGLGVKVVDLAARQA